MKLIESTPNCILEFNERERYQKYFGFDINLIVDVPVVGISQLIIRDSKKPSRYWSMDWNEFLNYPNLVVGKTVLIDRKEMRYHP